jgi:hypothetical protein
MVQTMVVVHNIAGIQDYDEHAALRDNRRAAEKYLLQGFQETTYRGAKAFRDRARKLIIPFFVKGDGTEEEDEKYVHAMLSTFGFTGSTVLHHHHPAGHPVLLEYKKLDALRQRAAPKLYKMGKYQGTNKY